MIFRVKFDRTKNIKLRSRSNVNKGNFYYFSFPAAIYGLKKKKPSAGNETIPKSGKNGHSTFCKVQMVNNSPFWAWSDSDYGLLEMHCSLDLLYANST